MFRKLLKYDFRAILKYWWIAALVSFIMALLGGGFIYFLSSDKRLPLIVNIVSILGTVLVGFSFIAFLFATLILIVRRFYTNFFTDEGYLTFTLPVKKSQLLNSKLLSALVLQFATTLIVFIDIAVILGIGLQRFIFTEDFAISLKELMRALSLTLEAFGFYSVIYIAEMIIMMLFATVASTLFIFFCITFASLIAQKGRIIKAIALYYVISSIFGFIERLFITFCSSTIFDWYSALTLDFMKPVLALTLLVIILLYALISILLYTLQYRLLDKKLNLS